MTINSIGTSVLPLPPQGSRPDVPPLLLNVLPISPPSGNFSIRKPDPFLAPGDLSRGGRLVSATPVPVPPYVGPPAKTPHAFG